MKLSLTTNDGVLIETWHVKDGLYKANEYGYDLSKPIARQAVMSDILECIIKANKQESESK